MFVVCKKIPRRRELLLLGGGGRIGGEGSFLFDFEKLSGGGNPKALSIYADGHAEMRHKSKYPGDWSLGAVSSYYGSFYLMVSVAEKELEKNKIR